MGGTAGIGPAWTYSGIEAPGGEKNMGDYTIAVYTPEQQKRLGVDEQGTKVSGAVPMVSAARKLQLFDSLLLRGGSVPKKTRAQIMGGESEASSVDADSLAVWHQAQDAAGAELKGMEDPVSVTS